ncbi:MAG: YbfB/YjiJ family MFS transporter, partial [Proteobacteria bacterium]|nr:YbfB/YjiJ family MFS transporter [Pseudomonadota bacterium]
VEWVAPAGAVFAAVLLGGTFMGLTSLGLMAGREINPVAPQRTLANLTASFGVGQMIGPTLAGLLAAQTGSLRAPSLAAAGALVLCAFLALSEARRRRRA